MGPVCTSKDLRGTYDAEDVYEAHSCKNAVQRVYLVENILDKIMRVREKRQRVARLLVTKFCDKYFSYSQVASH